MTIAVTLDEMIQDGHPNPPASARRRFASEEDKQRWRETIRRGLYAYEQRILAERIAAQHGEQI